MKRSCPYLSAVLVLLLVSCGGDEYSGFRKALRHQYRMMDEFTVAVAGASGPEEIAAALKKFQKEAVAGREWMLKMTTEHPGLADLDRENLPEDLRTVLERIEEVTPRFVDALRRVETDYGRDPAVRKALDEMDSVLSPSPR